MHKIFWSLIPTGILLLSSCVNENSPDISVSTPEIELSALSIKNMPYRTQYFEGESFSRAGMQILATFSDQSQLIVPNTQLSLSTTGGLTLDTDKVIASYLSRSIEIPISVLPMSLEKLTVSSLPYTTTYAKGQYFAFNGLKILATSKNGVDFSLNEEDYQLSISGYTSSLADEITLESGTYQVDVSAYDSTTSFAIQIVTGYKIEAEDILFSEPDSETKSYVRVRNQPGTNYLTQPNSFGGIRKIEDETALLASSNSYLGDISLNNVIDFFFYSEQTQMADINFRASSCYLTKGDGWDPIAMGDELISRLFTASFNGDDAVIDQNAYLPGKESTDGQIDMSLWVNWQTVNFSHMQVNKGWNMVSFNVISDYVNYLGYFCSFNFDYLSVNLI
ncbi:MAG: bacterial Ig-like domain-containing protein [Bacilli bacterium]